MHIREVVSKNYSPRGNFIKVWNTRGWKPSVFWIFIKLPRVDNFTNDRSPNVHYLFWYKMVLKICGAVVSIQLTNWILWNGKLYYRDVIKMTITRAKGEGNGHFYHIEVIDLPFHTIPFVSCFISLRDNLRASKFTGSLFFSFAYYASFDAQLCAQPRAVRADNDNRRRLSSQDYASIGARPMLILIHWPSSEFTVPHTRYFARHT